MNKPRPERRVDAGLDREGRVSLKERCERLADHPRLGQRQDVAGTDQPTIAPRAARAHVALLDESHAPAGLAQVVGTGEADHASAHNHDVACRATHGLIPMTKGSFGSRINVASLMM